MKYCQATAFRPKICSLFDKNISQNSVLHFYTYSKFPVRKKPHCSSTSFMPLDIGNEHSSFSTLLKKMYSRALFAWFRFSLSVLFEVKEDVYIELLIHIFPLLFWEIFWSLGIISSFSLFSYSKSWKLIFFLLYSDTSFCTSLVIMLLYSYTCLVSKVN